ncbi:MAG: transposase [Clostridia bacterium]|nr:transposase [Clostridia bacterium]
MPRLARKYLETSFLHLIVQGVNKEYIFYKKEYIEKYLEIFKENSDKYNYTIIAYCVMNNHAHFLIYAEDMNKLAKGMQKTNLLFAQMYNRKEHRVGVVFRNRYQIEPIYNLKYLINCIKYIHNNPVKAKMVLKCEDYEYSTYKDYANNVGVSRSEIMKKIFGKKCNYLELFNESPNNRFMDIEEYSSEQKKQYILEAIYEFRKRYCKSTFEIFSDRDVLKKLIWFLKEKFGCTYVEIRNYFEISRGTMESLKIK